MIIKEIEGLEGLEPKQDEVLPCQALYAMLDIAMSTLQRNPACTNAERDARLGAICEYVVELHDVEKCVDSYLNASCHLEFVLNCQADDVVLLEHVNDMYPPAAN